jgi:hypothetical protein
MAVAALSALFAFAGFISLAETNTTKATVIVLVGAPGEEDFGKVFVDAAANWEKAALTASANFVRIGSAPSTGTNATNDLQEFRAAMARESMNTSNDLWIALVGHGTFDGRETKFNLRGPDLSANDLSNLLAAVHRPAAIINGASSSAPFIKSLSATNRVVITATRSGAEENFTRFGKYIAQAIADPEADLDKDGQTSLLEAYLMASRRVSDFYKGEGRLATEHALLDDNGDGMGTPADWFRGIRAVKTAANGAALDGMRAHQWHLVRSTADQKLTPEQRKQRDELELEIARLRQDKSTLNEDEYYRQLEALLTKLGAIELSGGTNAPVPPADSAVKGLLP